jgi:hypothetical protein
MIDLYTHNTAQLLQDFDLPGRAEITLHRQGCRCSPGRTVPR